MKERKKAASAAAVLVGTRTSSMSSMTPHHLAPDYDPSADLMQQKAMPTTPQRRRQRHHVEDNSPSSSIPSASPSASAFSTPDRDGSQIQSSDFSSAPGSCDTNSLASLNIENNSTRNASPLMAVEKETTAYYVSRNLLHSMAGSAASTLSPSEHNEEGPLSQDHLAERQKALQDHHHDADTSTTSLRTSEWTESNDDVYETSNSSKPPSLRRPASSSTTTARHRYSNESSGRGRTSSQSKSQSSRRWAAAVASPVRAQAQSSILPPASRSSSVSRGGGYRRTPFSDDALFPDTIDETEAPTVLVVEQQDKKPPMLSVLVQASPLRARWLAEQPSHDSSSMPLRFRPPETNRESSIPHLASTAISHSKAAVMANTNNPVTPQVRRLSPAAVPRGSVTAGHDGVIMTAMQDRERASSSRTRDDEHEAPPTSPALSQLFTSALKQPNSLPTLSTPVRFASPVSVRPPAVPRNTETPDSTSKQSQSSPSLGSLDSITTNSLNKDSTVTKALNITTTQTAAKTDRNAMSAVPRSATTSLPSHHSPAQERAPSPLARNKLPVLAPMLPVQTPPELTPPPLPPTPAANAGTPKTANRGDRKSNVSGTATAVSNNSSAFHGDWSKMAVATTAHSASMTLSKLKTFAEVPRIVNTELKSLSRDKDSGYHTTLEYAEVDTLDLTELAQELRRGGRHEEKSYVNHRNEDMQTIRAKFSMSDESVGKPKPPVLQSNSISAHWKKPNEMEAVLMEAAKPGQLQSVMPRARKELHEAAHDNKNPSAHKQGSPSEAAAVAITAVTLLSLTNKSVTHAGAARQMTPIERMRLLSPAESSYAPETLHRSTKQEMSPRMMDDDEIIVQKQRRRKEQTEMAEITRKTKLQWHQDVLITDKSPAATRSSSNSATNVSKFDSKSKNSDGDGSGSSSIKSSPREGAAARGDRLRRQRPLPRRTEILRCSPSKIQQVIHKILEGRCGENDIVLTEEFQYDPAVEASEEDEAEPNTHSDSGSERKLMMLEVDETKMTTAQLHGLQPIPAHTAAQQRPTRINSLVTPRDMMPAADAHRMVVVDANISAPENEDTEDDLDNEEARYTPCDMMSAAEAHGMVVVEAVISASENDETEDDLDNDEARYAAHFKQSLSPPLFWEALAVCPFNDEAQIEQGSLSRHTSPSKCGEKRSSSKSRKSKPPFSAQSSARKRTLSSPTLRVKQRISPARLREVSQALSPTDQKQSLTPLQPTPVNDLGEGWRAKLEDNIERDLVTAVQVREESFIGSFIAGMTDWGMAMRLHRKGRRRSKEAPRVIVQLYNGGWYDQAVSSLFVPPRLQMSTTQGIICFAASIFHICFLEKATINHLHDYPNAVPGHGALVRFATEELLLEAPDEHSAMRFVHGIKWLVARLSFNLIIGNLHVSCELLDTNHLDESDHKEGECTAIRVDQLKQARHMRAVNDLANILVDTCVQTLGKGV